MKLRSRPAVDYCEIPKNRRKSERKKMEGQKTSGLDAPTDEAGVACEKRSTAPLQSRPTSPRVSTPTKEFVAAGADSQMIELQEVLPENDDLEVILMRSDEDGAAAHGKNWKPDPRTLNRADDSLDESSNLLLSYWRQSRFFYWAHGLRLKDVIIGMCVMLVLTIGIGIIWWLLQNSGDWSGAVVVGPVQPPDRHADPEHQAISTPTPTVVIIVNLRGFVCTYGTLAGNICVSLGRGICVKIGEHVGRWPSSVKVRAHSSCNIEICSDFVCYEEL